MAEKTAERSGHQGQEEEQIEVTVVFHAHAVTVKVKRGSTYKEVWEAVKKKAEEEGIEIGDPSKWTITIDEKIVVIDDVAGTVKEVDEETGAEREIQDETVEEDIVIVLTENVEGGKQYN